MFEKVNPSHPDKVADRIAGAIVDYAYEKKADPKIAVEVLLGHGKCFIIMETDVDHLLLESHIKDIVYRIVGTYAIGVEIKMVQQDEHLADNQRDSIRCGDNGIFKGALVTPEQHSLTNLVGYIYEKHPSDGKYFVDDSRIVVCQSNASNEELLKEIGEYGNVKDTHIIINPLGPWTGGIDVDSGATNRKLGSDMGDSITGGGLHGKDLSKADVSLNIFAWLVVNNPKFLKSRGIHDIKINSIASSIGYLTSGIYCLTCAIGDETVCGIPYSRIVNMARDYINQIGGFEKFAEWGLIRPQL